MRITRSRVLHALVAAAVSAVLATPATAQTTAPFPSRPIKIIVPAAAGSGPDTLARLIADHMATQFGKPVVVEDVPGLAGSLGAAKVLSEPADGYTLLFGFNQIPTMNPHVYRKLPYDYRQLAPVSLVGRGGYLLIANNALPFNDVAGLIASASKAPGKFTFASTGTGGSQHLGMVLLQQSAGITLLHVPYKAGGAANTDLISGQVDLMLEPMISGSALVRSKRVKALAITRPERAPIFPDLPTVGETIKGFELAGWNAIWTRAGTPPAVIDTLNAAVRTALTDPALAEKIRDRGLEPKPSTPDELGALTASEFARWKGVIQKAGLQPE